MALLEHTIKKGDTRPTVKATLSSGSLASATVKFIMKNRDTGAVVINASATITDAPNGKVQYSWSAGQTATAGTFLAEFQVTFSGGLVETYPNSDYIIVNIVEDIAD